jgi:hypothetical protein
MTRGLLTSDVGDINPLRVQLGMGLRLTRHALNGGRHPQRRAVLLSSCGGSQVHKEQPDLPITGSQCCSPAAR